MIFYMYIFFIINKSYGQIQTINGLFLCAVNYVTIKSTSTATLFYWVTYSLVPEQNDYIVHLETAPLSHFRFICCYFLFVISEVSSFDFLLVCTATHTCPTCLIDLRLYEQSGNWQLIFGLGKANCESEVHELKTIFFFFLILFCQE